MVKALRARHPALTACHETARTKFVFAPTYNDVTKPVYTRAMKRWEHYGEALEPVREQLATYCKACGYWSTANYDVAQVSKPAVSPISQSASSKYS